MSTRTLGMLATIAGATLGVWWLVTQQRLRAAAAAARGDRGTVVFDNTPRAAEVDAVI